MRSDLLVDGLVLTLKAPFEGLAASMRLLGHGAVAATDAVYHFAAHFPVHVTVRRAPGTRGRFVVEARWQDGATEQRVCDRRAIARVRRDLQCLFHVTQEPTDER